MWWIAACAGPASPPPPTDTLPPPVTDTAPPLTDPDPTTTPTPPTGPTHTITGTGPGVIDATCTMQLENVLRATCAVQLGDEGAAHITLTNEGTGEEWTWTSSGPATVHEITVDRMRANQDHSWLAWSETGPGTRDGTMRSGVLPSTVDFDGFVEATPEATVGDVLLPYTCGKQGMMVAVDPEGQVVWYEDSALRIGSTVGIDVTGFRYDPAERAITVILRHDDIAEYDLSGHLRMHLVRGIDWDAQAAAHHDIVQHEGKTYVLAAAESVEGDTTYILDRVLRFDADGLLDATWDLAGRYDYTGYAPPPTGYWGLDFDDASIDISHANGLTVLDDGDLLLSFRHLHTVMQVAGFDAPDAGTVRWTFVGQSDVPIESTYTKVSSAFVSPLDFSVQHHASFTADGRLIFLDNRQFTVASRVVEWVLDDATGEADLLDEYDIDGWCVVQGGVYELPSGNLLATCATTQTVVEFERGGDAIWTFEPDCGGFSFTSIVRAQPIDFFPELP